jgi:hypothetical protein
MQALSTGVTVLVYEESDAHDSNDNETFHIRFSDDYGTTWTARDTDLNGNAVARFPMSPTGAEAGQGPCDPHLKLCPNGDLLLHMWRGDYGGNYDGTQQTRSTDGGITWSEPAQVAFVGLDEATNNLCFMTDDYFVYDGVVYVSVRVYNSQAGAISKAAFVKSTDNGVAWVYVSDISDFATHPTEECGIEYLGNNTIICILRHDGNAYTWKSVSTDMGATWSVLEDITGLIGATARQRIYTDAHLKGEANWWEDTNLIMEGFALTSPGSSHPRHNGIWYSKDSGATWTPLFLDNIYVDGGYGDVIYNPTLDKYVVVSYRGDSLEEADLVQYTFPINWA